MLNGTKHCKTLRHRNLLTVDSTALWWTKTKQPHAYNWRFEADSRCRIDGKYIAHLQWYHSRQSQLLFEWQLRVITQSGTYIGRDQRQQPANVYDLRVNNGGNERDYGLYIRRMQPTGWRISGNRLHAVSLKATLRGMQLVAEYGAWCDDYVKWLGRAGPTGAQGSREKRSLLAADREQFLKSTTKPRRTTFICIQWPC